MARRFGSEKISKELVTVSIVCPTKTDIVAGQQYFIFAPKQIIATNTGLTSVGIKFCEGNDALTPTIVISGSGTYQWDIPTGMDLELATGSGLTACLTSAGTVDVAAFYVSYDRTPGITKEDARNATFIASQATAIRTPNEFGNQTKS